MIVRELYDYMNELADFSLQESYDNAGLLIGDFNKEINTALLSLDITNEVINEAAKAGAEKMCIRDRSIPIPDAIHGLKIIKATLYWIILLTEKLYIHLKPRI